MTESKSIVIEHKKIQRMGEYYYFSIPKPLVDNKIVLIDKEYTIKLEEVPTQ